jgi:Malate/L-lactate dehydrogenases
LPITTFKKSRLASIVNILNCIFTGVNHGRKIKNPFDDFSVPQNIGHFFFVLKSTLFITNFNKRIKTNINQVKNLPQMKPLIGVLYPCHIKFNPLLKIEKKFK